jgi:hypothetical protein
MGEPFISKLSICRRCLKSGTKWMRNYIARSFFQCEFSENVWIPLTEQLQSYGTFNFLHLHVILWKIVTSSLYYSKRKHLKMVPRDSTFLHLQFQPSGTLLKDLHSLHRSGETNNYLLQMLLLLDLRSIHCGSAPDVQTNTKCRSRSTQCLDFCEANSSSYVHLVTIIPFQR